ncbi:tripartite motif-containing protein 10-like [Hemicordylus capensis]|uniref:tripartite motif-containing protein 10-like n=1 Tax=Hemicordylus capensis TaxID=884348 RepID=UPI002302E582|nr:tripartite motif-containing protein 10-like [Hemicordylus capensis]
MAAVDPVKDLCTEATCPICLDYFKDPVTITECGHNFCQACLTRCWEDLDREASCPHCRKRVQKTSFIPNWQLKSVVEIAKEFQRGERKGKVCEEHQERLKLFCKNHGTLICVVCDRSKEHENHKVIPLEEACQQYKAQICCCLDMLRKERKTILSYQADATKESQDLLNQTKAERQKTVAEFRQLRQFLEEQEKLLLAQMEEVEKEIAARREEQMVRLSEELSTLDNMIQDMEKKSQQPASELLQDIKRTLGRYHTKNKYTNPVMFSPALKWKFWELCDINPFLEAVRKQLKDTLLLGLQLKKANVTLDPDTANPWLLVSEDRKSVTCGREAQDRPPNRERFDNYTFVLGCEGFTTGRHCWDVTVASEGDWAVGVARKSVRRKGKSTFDPKDGIWGIWKSTWSLSEDLKRIRVSLNCPGRRLTFFDADTAALIHRYSEASFSGETLLPFFYVDKDAHLRLSQTERLYFESTDWLNFVSSMKEFPPFH